MQRKYHRVGPVSIYPGLTLLPMYSRNLGITTHPRIGLLFLDWRTEIQQHLLSILDGPSPLPYNWRQRGRMISSALKLHI